MGGLEGRHSSNKRGRGVKRTQTFIIHRVEPDSDGSGWTIVLGPDPGDPWLTVVAADLKTDRPCVGDMVEVMLPKVIKHMPVQP